jgi:hypothetical protein
MKKLALLLLLASPLLAQRSPREGAIVITDDAPVYADSKGEKVEWKLKRGDAVAGYMSQTLHIAWQLDEVDGRVHVFYFKTDDKKGGFVDHKGWMDPKDLSRFSYEDFCGKDGAPYSVKGLGSIQWNPCFEKARDDKLDKLRATFGPWAAGPSPAPTSVPTTAPIPVPAEPATK